MTQAIDNILAQQYGEYAGFQTTASPYLIDYYGENPEQEIKRLLPLYLRPTSRLLDIGCGAGKTICQFAPQVQEAWGFDADAALLQGARERAQAVGLTNTHWVMGGVTQSAEIDQLPDNYFDVAFTESGPNLNTALLQKLTKDAYFLQETGGKFGSYQLHAILGRKPYTYYAYSDEYNDQAHLSAMAALDLAPVCYKNYFYEWFFRDLAHLEAFVTQVVWALGDWRMGQTMPYLPERDQAALTLYARYNMTAKGIRLLQHVRVFVWRRVVIHYYPVDSKFSK